MRCPRAPSGPKRSGAGRSTCWKAWAAPQAASAPAAPAPPPYPEYFRPAILAHLIRRLRDPHPMDTYGQTTLKAEVAAELARLTDGPETDGPDNPTRRAELSRTLDDALERFQAPTPGGAPAPADRS